ncbi:MAG: hypothetical protein B7Z80_08665 [Rhodospirillales bacterium 20-64-7]|nr:MAG: hypothetical protein B7Z80_08665 [Rhodospirillales bacterium 20-64-7]
MASQIEKDSTGSLRGGNLAPNEIIITPGQNYRDMTSDETKAHIAWLKESIKAEGVKNPIDVIYSDGKWYLAPGGGECRLTAAKLAQKEGWKGLVPCFQVKGDEAYLLKKSILGNTGLPPSLLDLGKALQQLVDWKLPMEEILHCVPPSITTDPSKAIRVARKALELNAAPLAVKEAVQKGVDGVKISPARAVAEAKRNPLTAAENLKTAAAKAKEKGQPEVKREKGEGKALKARKSQENSIAECLRLADALADVAVDMTLDREEVIACAEKYNEARNR